MSILRRSLLLYQVDNSDTPALYQALHDDLQREVAGWLTTDTEDLAGWPSGSWQNDIRVARGTEWKVESGPPKLLQLVLQQQKADDAWEVDFLMGQKSDDLVVISEDWRTSTYRRDLPIHAMPDLFAFVTRYECKNEDGYLANRYYSVDPERVEAFVEFIQSPERHLPIILVSPLPTSPTDSLVDCGELARKVRGIAHVTRLRNNVAVGQLISLLPDHSCYNGAVRLYWPGFSRTDSLDAHPFWLPRVKPDEVKKQLFEQLARESPRLLGQNADIDHLKWQKEESQRHLERTTFKEALKRIEAEQDAREFTELYQLIEKERDELQARVEYLEQQNADLRDQMRGLRFRVNSAWQRGERASTIDEPSVRVYLSAKAQAAYAALDQSERSYWDEHLWYKLLDSQMRDNQSEPIHGPSGPCWVYPRSGTADGRRVVYFCEDDDVYVCEILPASEHDGRYRELRDRGVDRSSYVGFELWNPDHSDGRIMGMSRRSVHSSNPRY